MSESFAEVICDKKIRFKFLKLHFKVFSTVSFVTVMACVHTTIGETFLLNWPTFMQRLFHERAALRCLGFEDANDIIQQQFLHEQQMRASGDDFTRWDEHHLRQMQETISVLRELGQHEDTIQKLNKNIHEHMNKIE